MRAGADGPPRRSAGKGADTLTNALRDAPAPAETPGAGGVIFTNPAAECTRCHLFEGTAANVGPNLSKIGATLSRDQLVEAARAERTDCARLRHGWRLADAAHGAILKPKEIRDIVEFLSVLKGSGADKREQAESSFPS